MCLLVSKCCNARTSCDQYGLRRCKFCLLPTSVKLNSKLRRFLSIGLFSIMFMFSITTKEQSHTFVHRYTLMSYILPVDTVKDIHFTGNEKIDDSIFFDALLEYNIFNPEYAIKSSKYETGHYKSDLCVLYNNMFGTTYVQSEYQDSFVIVPIHYTDKKGIDRITYTKFATYKTKINSIKDHRRAQKYYSKEIDSRYAEDNKNYTASLNDVH